MSELLPSTANQAWFWCETHVLAHRGTYHNGQTEDACADVGPYSSQQEAEAFPQGGLIDE